MIKKNHFKCLWVIKITLGFVLFLTNTHGASYIKYHQLINRAEKEMFLNKDYKTATKYYDSSFAMFDFVFAKDPYMALQLSFENNDLGHYYSYLTKGAQNGISIFHLNLNKSLKEKLSTDKAFKSKTTQIISVNRPKYLARIDTHLLQKYYLTYTMDQCLKVRKDYYITCINNMELFINTISTKGFPGEKLLGIDQKDIMKELGFENRDLSSYYLKLKDKYPSAYLSPMQFYTDDNTICQSKIYTLLYHFPCSYEKLEKYFQSNIEQGFIHPREVALLYDNLKDSKRDEQWTQCNCKIKPQFYFRIHPTIVTEPIFKYTSIDSIRKANNINPLIVDSLKCVYCIEKGINYKTGYYNCYVNYVNKIL